MTTYLIIMESEAAYQPIGEAFGLKEAHELIREDYAMRLKDMDAHLAPESYALWERGENGRYVQTLSLGIDEI